MTMFGSLRQVRSEHSEPQPEPISEYAPRPAPGPREIGGVMIEAVRQIFAGPAAKMRAIADRVEAGGKETADRWRALADQLEQRGDMECTSLAGLIDMTGNCDDTGKALLQALDGHNAQPEVPAPTPVDLDAIAAEIGEVKEEAGR